jgi:hypothetical protein
LRARMWMTQAALKIAMEEEKQQKGMKQRGVKK